MAPRKHESKRIADSSVHAPGVNRGVAGTGILSGRMRGEPVVRHNINHDPRAASQARRVLNELLRDCDELIADDVLLATNELVTNVVRHTENGGVLRVWDRGPGCTASGRGRRRRSDHPGYFYRSTRVRRTRPRDSPSGLCRLGRFDPLPAGKIVWAELERARLLDESTSHLPAE